MAPEVGERVRVARGPHLRRLAELRRREEAAPLTLF